MKNKPQFTSAHYNFRFKLDCTASGAAAQAEGGSTQIAAINGCMNQWLGNGVWKMRVTAIVPNQPSGQYGWEVAQEWMNPTSRTLLTGGLPSPPAVPTNVSNEYLVTQSGNSASSANTAGNMGPLGLHVFPPGGQFTYQQGFFWSPFDASDKPVRLLVTFDTKTQNALPNAPHYHIPANFRIDLTCTK